MTPARGLVERIRRRIPGAAFNLGSILSSNVVNRVTSFVVYAAAARAEGVVSFGHLALGMAVFTVGGRLAALGARPVVMRRSARGAADIDRTVGTSVVAQLGAWILGFAIVEAYLALAGYSADATTVIRVLYLGVGAHAVAQTSEGLLVTARPGLIPRITVPINLVQTAIALAILSVTTWGVIGVAWSIVAAHVMIAALLTRYAARALGVRARIGSMAFAREFVRESGPFLAAQSANVVASNGLVVVVSAIGSEVDVGLFAAAHQLLVPVAVISEALALMVYPMIVRRTQAGRAESLTLVRSSVEAMFALVVPAAVGLWVLARPLLQLVYDGEAFGGAETVIQVMALGTVARGVSQVLGQVMWADDNERASLRIALIRSALALSLTGWFMAMGGVVGAAVGGLVASVVNMALHLGLVSSGRGRLRLVRAMTPSVVSSLAMALMLMAVADGVPVLLRIAGGAVVYGGALFAFYRVTQRRLGH